MAIELTGSGLTLDDLLRVARGGEAVELAPAAVEAMRAARAVAEEAVAQGVAAYGVTTGVGMRKAFGVEAADHDRILIRQHLIGQGPGAPRDVVRATALRLANALAGGLTPVRAETAQLVVEALNEDRLP